MPWAAEYNQILHTIELVYTGGITARDMQESTSKCITMGKDKGTNKFLLNAIAAEFSATLFDIYNIPTQQYFDEEADRSGRVAVVLPRSPEAKKAAEFYEIVCTNRGWMVKVFPEHKEAVDWLIDYNSLNDPDTDNVL